MKIMNQVKKYGPKMAGAGALVGVTATNAAAAFDLTEVGTALTDAITDVHALAALILVALAGLFVVRKMIKTTNRS